MIWPYMMALDHGAPVKDLGLLPLGWFEEASEEAAERPWIDYREIVERLWRDHRETIERLVVCWAR